MWPWPQKFVNALAFLGGFGNQNPRRSKGVHKTSEKNNKKKSTKLFMIGRQKEYVLKKPDGGGQLFLKES